MNQNLGWGLHGFLEALLNMAPSVHTTPVKSRLIRDKAENLANLVSFGDTLVQGSPHETLA